MASLNSVSSQSLSVCAKPIPHYVPQKQKKQFPSLPPLQAAHPLHCEIPNSPTPEDHERYLLTRIAEASQALDRNENIDHIAHFVSKMKKWITTYEDENNCIIGEARRAIEELGYSLRWADAAESVFLSNFCKQIHAANSCEDFKSLSTQSDSIIERIAQHKMGMRFDTPKFDRLSFNLVRKSLLILLQHILESDKPYDQIDKIKDHFKELTTINAAYVPTAHLTVDERSLNQTISLLYNRVKNLLNTTFKSQIIPPQAGSASSHAAQEEIKLNPILSMMDNLRI